MGPDGLILYRHGSRSDLEGKMCIAQSEVTISSRSTEFTLYDIQQSALDMCSHRPFAKGSARA